LGEHPFYTRDLYRLTDNKSRRFSNPIVSVYYTMLYIFIYVSLPKSRWRFATKLRGIVPHSLVN